MNSLKLNIDFGLLHHSVRQMGAEDRDFSLNIELPDIDPIDIELETGISITLDDIERIENRPFSYKGRQVILYIQDHGFKAKDVLIDGSKGHKYHLTYCSTLEKMYNNGRFERYVVTNNTTGNFEITGYDPDTGEYISGSTELDVCKNCLSKLNYKEYKNNRAKVFSEFSLEDFFETYQAYFKHKPKRKAGQDNDGTYSSNWKEKSASYRESKNWTCESCGLNLSTHKSLLHTHHKNGVKSDNRDSNLQALCIRCHKDQPNHQHMMKSYTLDKQMKINKLRREQGI